MAENPGYNPTTALAHAILCGTSGWAFHTIQNESSWALGAFSLLFGHGLIGVAYFGHPKGSKHIHKVYKYIAFITELLPLPVINTQLYLIYSMDKRYAYANILTTIAPIITAVTGGYDKTEQLIDLIIVGNLASLLYIAFFNDNAWAAGLLTLTTINHFFLKRLSKKYYVPKSDFIAIGLSFFNIFAINCIQEAKS